MSNYPWQSIDPKDFIRIEASDSITLKDVHALTKLYQPLIGAQAYALYLALFSSVDFQFGVKNTTVSQLLTKIEIGIPDFFKARLKLEGIGLMRIYHSKEGEGDYFYEMIPPLSAENFFKDSLLRTLLIEKIGERLFREEMDNLLAERTDKQGYEETTRSFLDVYHFDFENTEVLSQTDFMPFDTSIQPKVAKTIEKTDTFDYTFFKTGLDKHFVSKESLDAEIKELIYTFHIVYGIDELTMQSLILESADVESGKINKNKFTKNVENNYLNKHKSRGSIQPQEAQEEKEAATNEKEMENKDFSKAEISIVNHAKKTAPANYLASIKEQKGGFVTTNERWVLKELVEQSPLNKETINILLHYVLVIKESTMLDKNYTMTIANDWAQNKVNSAEEAIAKIKTIYNQPRKPNNRTPNKNYKKSYQKPKREEKLPDWAKDDNKAPEKEEKPTPSTTNKSKAIQDRLDRLEKLRQEREGN